MSVFRMPARRRNRWLASRARPTAEETLFLDTVYITVTYSGGS